jgi:two-component system nitrogen regulation sensor histidine kinase NtrY
MIENAALLGQQAYTQERSRVDREAKTMSGDLAGYLGEMPIDSLQFAEGFGKQVYYRNLSEALILTSRPNTAFQSLALRQSL